MRSQAVESTVVHVDQESDSGDPNRCEGEQLPDPGLSSGNVECSEEDEGNSEDGSDGIKLSLIPVTPWSG